MRNRDFIELSKEAAREAGAIQLEHLGKLKEVRLKSEANLVTEVDKLCETAIIEKIKSKFPDHDILAEEGGGERKNSSYKWIIDPLDGTTNYAHSYPCFCVSIALEYKGEIIVGAVYDPTRDELFSAEKGSGAFLNGEPIHVSEVKKVSDSLLATGFAYNVRTARTNNMNHFKDFVVLSQGVRRDGTAALDLSYVACGRFDGFWELYLFPWDVAAGFLMIEEAGGQVSTFDGKPFDVYSKEILASNRYLNREMSQILMKPRNKGHLEV